jgi:glycosyltransferase involved in cell wall biosynthesis
MHIAFVHSGADLYGASRALLRLAAALIERGRRVTVILPYDGDLRPALERCGATVLLHSSMTILTRPSASGSLRQLLLLPFSFFELVRLFRRLRPDVVHSNTAVILSAAPAAWILGIPHICHIREFFAEFPILWKFYRSYLAWFSTAIVCVSHAVAAQFEVGIRERKVRVIYDGIPELELRRDSTAAACRGQFGLDEHSLVAGVVGRIKTTRKGQEILVRAAALLKDRYPQARYLLVGSPFPGNESHLISLKAAMRASGVEDRFILTGDLADVAPAYACLDVLVLPSAMPEPFGLVLIEAMARRIPVIATSAGGPPEIIDHDRSGLLVPPGDAHALARALDRLFADRQLRLQLAANGRARFESMFEFNGFVDRMSALYSDTIRLAPVWRASRLCVKDESGTRNL